MSTEKNVSRLFNLLNRWLTYRVDCGGSDNYERVMDAIILLTEKINELDDTDNIWYLGEVGAFCLDDLIVGAFWHFTEWHSGQNSKSYQALSALGTIFEPSMSQPEEDNDAYIVLNDLADNTYNKQGAYNG